MAPRTAALLVALAAVAIAAAAAQAVDRPPFTLADLGTGAPEAVNCTDPGPLEGNWLEITQVSGWLAVPPSRAPRRA